MEHGYHEAIKELAENGDTAYMFKMREIYRRLFQIAESIRQASNIFCWILLLKQCENPSGLFPFTLCKEGGQVYLLTNKPTLSCPIPEHF